jgi:predicted small secreted protein
MKTTYFTAIALVILSLNGCNTFSGMGKDLQAGGKAITNAANDASPSKKSTTVHTTTNPTTQSTTSATQ